MSTKRASTKSISLPNFQVMAGLCLGHKVYRGFAPLHELAQISKADIFDQKKNPLGTQRNLSRQHARKAYEYVSTIESAFYPEIILNIRDSSYVKITTQHKAGQEYGTLAFVKDPRQTDSIIVSRMDGNHRLWFVDGHEGGIVAVTRPASFCFLLLTEINEELELFRAINDNQMGMNTSHLQNITARLLGVKALKVKDPASYIVQKLQKDKTSPLFQKIYEGGVLKREATLSGLTIANLRNTIQDMLTRSAKLSQFADTDAQYEIIKNYWIAVKAWLPDAWKRPADYIIFKGAGIYAIAYLGVEVIDRCLLKGEYKPDSMLSYLKKLPQNDILMSKGGIPYAGRAGGRKIASDLVADLEEEGEISLSRLQKMILGD